MGASKCAMQRGGYVGLIEIARIIHLFCQAVGKHLFPHVDGECSVVVRWRASTEPQLHVIEKLATVGERLGWEANSIREPTKAMSIGIFSSEAKKFSVLLVEEVNME